jgi:hypothetical protein
MDRRLLGIVAALITAGAIFTLTWMLATIFPFSPPANIEYWTAAERNSYFASMPTASYVTTLIGFLLGSTAAGWMATKVSQVRGNPSMSIVVAILLVLFGATYFFALIPGQPFWFIGLSLVFYVVFALFGYMVARLRS